MEDYTNFNRYKENGFVIIPGVLTPNELINARSLIYSKTESMPSYKRMIVISDILHDPDLINLLINVQFNEKVVSVLENIFNKKINYVNDLQIQCNMFGSSLSGGGWHIDAGSEVGNQYLHAPSYLFGKMGVYLQNNTLEFGGGIDVLPKTHKAFRFFNNHIIPQSLYIKFRHKLSMLTRRIAKLTVPIKAGDAVFFDSRLYHRSSPPTSVRVDSREVKRVSNAKIHHENSKYVLYWDAGTERDARHFLRNSCKRAMLEEIVAVEDHQELFYTDYLRYSYPTDYPSLYKKAVDNLSSVEILSLDTKKSELFKSL